MSLLISSRDFLSCRILDLVCSAAWENIANFFGTKKEPFLDLRDFGEALAVVVLESSKHDGKTYRVYSEAVTVQEVDNVYGDLLGRKITALRQGGCGTHGDGWF